MARPVPGASGSMRPIRASGRARSARGVLPLQSGSRWGAAARASRPVQRLPACRCLCRLWRAVSVIGPAPPGDACRLLCPRAPKILRSVAGDEIADRRAGGAPHRYALRDRGRNHRQVRRDTPGRATHPQPAIARAFKIWADEQRRRVSGKTALGKRLRLRADRWEALTCFATDGRLSIDNNLSERLLRGVPSRERTSCSSAATAVETGQPYSTR